MADKLDKDDWTGFVKKHKLELDDKALVKALGALDKAGPDKPDVFAAALSDVADEIKKQVASLVKRKKELGDKPFGLAKDKLYALLDLAEIGHKQALEDAADAKRKVAKAKGDDSDEDDDDSPAALTTKMVPLIRQLKKGELRLPAMIGSISKTAAVLISKRSISNAKRKLLNEALDAAGGVKYAKGECYYETGTLHFVMSEGKVGGLAKRVRAALLNQTGLRLKVKLRGEDGEDNDGEEEAEDAATASGMPAAPGAQAADTTARPAPPGGPASAAQTAYAQRLRQIKDPLAQALKAQHPESTKLRALMGFASEKADEKKDYAGATKALELIQQLLAPKAQVEADAATTPVEPSAPRQPTRPAGAYARMRPRILPQLEMARQKRPDLDNTISTGLDEADRLGDAGDDAAAVARLQSLIAQVQSSQGDERRAVEKRMSELYDKATRVRLDLVKDDDPDVVRSAVRDLVAGWNYAAAQTKLTSFEKAIDKAKPLDFEDLDIVRKRRSEAFRKENAKAARNTEQALLAARRVIDDDGNLVLDGGALKGLPLVRTDDLASVADEIRATGDGSLPQSVHALQMLQRLQKDKAAQEALKGVKAPKDPASAATPDEKASLETAQSLIRNVLGLADDAPIGDAEAKRAAMAALLSQARQGAVGSCFATASAVRLQRNRPEQVLGDMKEMFATGRLTREIEHPPGTKLRIEVPIARDMVDRKLDVNRQGTDLHQSPQMVAGLDALGVPDGDQKQAIEDAARRLRAERALDKALAKVARFLPATHTAESLKSSALALLDADAGKTIEAALSEVLDAVALSSVNKRSNQRKRTAVECAQDFDQPDGSDDFTPQELLKMVARQRSGGTPPADQLAAAKAAYDTSADNTLMRAWEYTLASMAEQHPGTAEVATTMSGGIGQAAADAANEVADRAIAAQGLAGDDATNERTVAGEVSAELSDRLERELKVRYDPEALSRSGAAAADGSSTKGGWSLYFRGKKIDGQAAFEDAVKTLLGEVKQHFDANTLGWPPQYVSRAKAVADKLREQAETQDFRDRAVAAMANGNDDQKDKFRQPWVMADSGWEYTVMQLQENQAAEPPSVNVGGYTYKQGGADKPVEDAEGLTHFLLDTLSKVAARLPDGDASKDAVVPVANTAHAFSLLPGSTSLQTLLKQGKDPGSVVEEFKAVEGAKNAKRRQAQVPLKDLGRGLVADMVADAVSILPADDQPAAIATIRARLLGLGVDAVSAADLKSHLRAAAHEVLNAYGLDPAEQDQWADKASNSAVSPARVLTGIVPEEEYGPLVDAAMRRMGVAGETKEKVRKQVLQQLKGKDAVVKDELAQETRKALRALGLGGRDDDSAQARKAYDALADATQRAAALKAAGKDVASPAATFDRLKDDERAALVEHGVAMRLDDRLAKDLIEPQGIVFADSNWGDGDHMTQFSMVVNPLSDPPAIEMWQMNEDGSDPAPMGEDWIKGSNWRVYVDADTYGGALGAHEVTTLSGKQPWEKLRAELRAKLDQCYAANKGDLGKMQRILDIADARFAAGDLEAADKAILKLAEELAPLDKLAAAVTQAVRSLERVSAEVRKQAAIADAKKAAAVVDGLIVALRSGVATPQDLTKLVAERHDLLDYIDRESPFGSVNLVQTLTLA